MKPTTRRRFLQSGGIVTAGMLGSAAAYPQSSGTGTDYDVIILGGGVAGLAAARSLVTAGPGLKVLLLEAGDRVGGRILTALQAQAPGGIELGARWLLGPDGSALHRDLSALGLLTEDAPLSGDDTIVFASPIDAPPPANIDRAVALKLLREYLEQRPGAALSLAELYVDAGDPRIPEALIDELAVVWGATPSELGARAALLETPAWVAHAGQRRRLLPACSALPSALARGLDGQIQLRSRATEVFWRDGLVGVYYDEFGLSRAVTAQRLIVTLPVGVLKAGDVTFTPSLPPWKAAALDGVAAGAESVAAMLFDPSLLADGSAGTGCWRSSDGRISIELLQDPGGALALRARYLAGADRALGAVDDDGLRKVTLTLLARLLARSGVEAMLLAYEGRRWHAEPLSLGAYAFSTPAAGSDRDALARAVAGTVFFAGDATAEAPHHRSLDGAYASGLRSAREVAGSLGLAV